jgi:hypothetical protein
MWYQYERQCMYLSTNLLAHRQLTEMSVWPLVCSRLNPRYAWLNAFRSS